jgi:hypothetical protein
MWMPPWPRSSRMCARAAMRCDRPDRAVRPPDADARQAGFSPAEIAAEVARVSPADRDALELAAERIRAYHARQLPKMRGTLDRPAWRKPWLALGPVSAAGLYVPGGWPLTRRRSDERDSCQGGGGGTAGHGLPDPRRGGQPLVLLAAQIAGVDVVYRIGGAQAIAALAYGTRPSPRWTRSPAPATPMSPQPSGGCLAASAST